MMYRRMEILMRRAPYMARWNSASFCRFSSVVSSFFPSGRRRLRGLSSTSAMPSRRSSLFSPFSSSSSSSRGRGRSSTRGIGLGGGVRGGGVRGGLGAVGGGGTGGAAATTGAAGTPCTAENTVRHAGQRTWAVVPSGTCNPLRHDGQLSCTASLRTRQHAWSQRSSGTARPTKQSCRSGCARLPLGGTPVTVGTLSQGRWGETSAPEDNIPASFAGPL